MPYQNQAFTPLLPAQITQGEDYSSDLKFAATDDLTGLTYQAEARTSPGATPAVAFAIDLTHASDSPPVVTLSLTSAQTAAMTPGEWCYDVWEINSAAGTKEPIVFDRLVVNARITEVTP